MKEMGVDGVLRRRRGIGWVLSLVCLFFSGVGKNDVKCLRCKWIK